MSKIMIIGLDGASWTALGPLMDDGTMPFLKKISGNGSSGNLRSVIPPVTAPAWASFMTGKRPDKNSVFEFRCFDIDSRQDYITNASYIQSETIWQILSRNDKKVISLNVPYTYPVYDVNGILISGMDTPSKESCFCSPSSIQQIISEKYPDYVPVMKAWDMHSVSSESKAISYIEELEKIIELRTELFIYLISEYDWDMSMVHFQETDYLQHVLWDKIMEAAGGRADQPVHKAIREFYRKVDASTERIWSIADSNETTLMVISDHGFTEQRGMIFPNVALEKSGMLLRERDDSLSDTLKSRLRNSDNPIMKIIYSFQKRARQALRANRDMTVYEKLEQKKILENIPVVWDKTRAVMVMGSLYAFIYVKDDNSVNACKEVLENMRETENNELLFEKILTFNEAYGRSESETNNIIVAIPREGYAASRRFNDKEYRKDSFFPGVHHPNGIYVGYGNKINGELKHDLDLIDIVPTCLHLLGLPLPSDMDGNVAGYVISNDNEVKKEEVNGNYSRGKQEYDSESEELIKERLRSLGYLE